MDVSNSTVSTSSSALHHDATSLAAISFDLDVAKGEDASAILSERLKVFSEALERAKNAPLAIYIVSQSRFCKTAPPQLLTAIQTIKSYLPRIRRLELAIPFTHLVHFVGISVPSIRHFALDVTDQLDDMMCESRRKKKDLKGLTINAEFVRLRVFHMEPIILCYNKVVQMNINCIMPKDLLKILRNAPLIRILKASKVISASELERSNRLVHQNLEEVSIEFCYEDGAITHVHDVLNQLTLPGLRSLVFPNTGVHTGSLTDFFRRSRCPLRYIALDAPETLKELRSLLSLTPRLQILRLDTMREETFADVFDTIFGVKPDGLSLPNLKEFYYSGFWEERSPDWKFLIRAFAASPTLQHLEMTVYVYLRDLTMEPIWMGADEVEAMRKLRNEGKEIDIECWASGNHFEDFVEASQDRPTLGDSGDSDDNDSASDEYEG